MIIWGVARGNLNRRAEESGWFAIILLGVLFGFQDFHQHPVENIKRICYNDTQTHIRL